MTDVAEFLAHHGVKGQKWGVRNSDSTARVNRSDQTETGKGWSIDSDGAITIDKSATISRVVRNTNGLFGGTGLALDSGAPVYAAFKPRDITDYEHFFGRSKSLTVKQASTVLKLAPTSQLKAPGPKEASRIFYDVAKKDPEARADLESLARGFAKKGVRDGLAGNHESQAAYDAYTVALDAGNYNQKRGGLNQKYFAALNKAGYNMLLDPSDAAGGFDSPIIVLNGKNLSLKSQYVVDKVSAEKARLAYKSQQATNGKVYLEKLGYY